MSQSAQSFAAKFSVLALAAAAKVPALGAEPPPRIETLTWLSGEPLMPLDAKANMVSRLLPFLQQHWPETRHAVVQANARRSWQTIANGEAVCVVSSVPTPERLRQAYFTLTLLGPPQQLIVRRDRLAGMPRTATGEIDLVRLLADRQFQGALVEGRSYGNEIDDLLARRPRDAASGAAGSLVFYAGADFGSKILPMLAIGRADYTIGYETVLTQSLPANPQLSRLVSQNIAGASEPVMAGVACPRTPWGLAAIRHIDRLLGTPAGAAMLREESERWMSPETRHQYAGKLDSFYKERAKPSVIR